MKKLTAGLRKKETLRFRKAGKCFVIGKAAGDFLPGRKLVDSYEDQFKRRYIKIDGELEIVKEEHGFLAA